MLNRLLVIDDETSITKAIEIVARGCGYEVQSTSDPDDFAGRLTDWQPTHIMLDLQMPVMDGVELMRSLGERRVTSKIIIASGVDGRIVESARRIGAERGLDIAGTLLKPFRSAELRELLERVRVQEEDWRTKEGLAAALAGEALFLTYQPKIELTTGQLVGFEALVRWRHARHGVIFPDQFIPLAESSGLIDRLTDAVIDLGLKQAVAWGLGNSATLAINLSAGNLHDLTFADRLGERCAAAGVDPRRLVLELTETNAMADPLGAMEILTRLRLKGVALSIDDFGTGYSSLSQLARLPFSELKIDKSFVMAMPQSPEARAIVKSTIDLAHNMGLKAVAEGVETAEIQRLIAELGCDMAQGYHIAKPMPAEAIKSWSAEWDERRRADRSKDASDDARPRPLVHSPWSRAYDGSEDMKAMLTQALADRINPLWDLGRQSLVGWRPCDGGIEVLMLPYQNIVGRFAQSQRLLRGRRLMGDGTFAQARDLADVPASRVALPFRVADAVEGAVSTEDVEQVLRRYGITETQHRAVALFDIVGFSKHEPQSQVALLNSLECSINTAQGILKQAGKPIDLARTTTGDGFYVWNRDKGPQADLNTYLLTMLVLADNAIARREGQIEMVPEIRTCFSVGPHYSYHQVEELDPRGHDYIVGNITIGLARMIAKCLPGQILIGDFSRPTQSEADPANPLEFMIGADGAFSRFDKLRLHGRTVQGVRCYLTGEAAGAGRFGVTRFRIRDKHGFDHHVFNQKFNIRLSDGIETGLEADRLYLGWQQAKLGAFEAEIADHVASV